jgi:DNA-binding beta-propeller fold protein YncE
MMPVQRTMIVLALWVGFVASSPISPAHAAHAGYTVAATGRDILYPNYLALDAHGNVYVTEGDRESSDGTHRIQELSPSGDVLQTWTLKDAWPFGIAVSSTGIVYVSDLTSSHPRILILSPSGTVVTSWPIPAYGITVDGHGYVYAALGVQERIVKISPTGTVVRTWVPKDIGMGTLAGPQDVAVDAKGYVYATLTESNLVEKFSPTGKRVATWGNTSGYKPTPGHFGTPSGIAQRGNRVYVTEESPGWVTALSSKGKRISQWAPTGQNPNSFFSALGIAVSADGTVYVADQYNSRIVVFSATGSVVKVWK